MKALSIIQGAICVLTAAVGLYVIFMPGGMEGLTGVSASRARGLTEIRAGMGAFYLGLGIVPLAFGMERNLLRMLGIIYLIVAAVRLVSMAVDKSFEGSNLGFMASELLFGALLLIP